MRDRPLVSVVVPVYNAERFLAGAIDSVFRQEYHDWELLVVDDGSTDGSRAIPHVWASREPDRVLVLEHPNGVNRGQSASQNLGMRHARGELIALLDADDVWRPHKLAEQVALLQAHPDAVLVHGAFEYWVSWSRGCAAQLQLPGAGSPL